VPGEAIQNCAKINVSEVGTRGGCCHQAVFRLVPHRIEVFSAFIPLGIRVALRLDRRGIEHGVRRFCGSRPYLLLLIAKEYAALLPGCRRLFFGRFRLRFIEVRCQSFKPI